MEITEKGKEIIRKEFKDMDFLETLKDMPCRLISTIHKLAGLKGVIIALTMYLGKAKIIPIESFSYTWIIIVIIVIFDYKALDFIKEIKK